ncbi:GHKL domain-containing protein [Mediterraneibacter catenae]|uniref:GHKL domain-containing protein n=1 Tax=Mediterraneibacter catenae TaxID=2594882 RepID=A0A5M9I0P1_9FIRM|nr:sensor histidine kinase [Mediterraneibacter catenae]KAA8501319.1 GHKL domain-containing protein [Mediterraneibacter catenae]
MNVADIPKVYTALAEWASCLIFVLGMKKRWGKWKTAGILAVFLAALCVLQYYIGVWPVAFWIPAMGCAMLLMCACIWLCCAIPAASAALCFSVAFMAAEFVASVEWQIYSFLLELGYGSVAVEIILFLLFYAGLFTGLYFLVKRYFSDADRRNASWQEAAASVLMAVAAFLISNISYVYPNTPFSSSLPAETFYIRTLVDFSGVLILFLQQERWREMTMKKEVDAVNSILHRQYEQYNLSKENIEMINRKYHDLKHQIGVIRAERDSEKREQYLAEMEEEIKTYEAQNKTGNQVLDTILTGKHLYCMQHDINFTCVADGHLLDGMNVMDICTIFGNALDNAIEYEEKIEDKKKRLIRVAVYSQNRFIIIRVENYCEVRLTEGNHLPETTKKNKEYHGYGLKSIRTTAEKYGGSMTVKTEDDWFYLRVLIPKTEKL